MQTNLQRKNILAKKIGRNGLVNSYWEPAQSAFWLKSLRKPKKFYMLLALAEVVQATYEKVGKLPLQQKDTVYGIYTVEHEINRIIFYFTTQSFYVAVGSNFNAPRLSSHYTTCLIICLSVHVCTVHCPKGW